MDWFQRCQFVDKYVVIIVVIGILGGFGFSQLFNRSRLESQVNYSRNQYELPLKKIKPKQEQLETMGVSEKPGDRLRILCFVLTYPKNHREKALHVKATWGKRCSKLLFMSSASDARLPAINLQVSDGRKYLWQKTKEALVYIYKNHRRSVDWILKADDDTYVVMENLRYLLINYNTSDNLYFGHHFRTHGHEFSYMYGGAGYVLSLGALHRFVNEGLRSPALCNGGKKGDEDYELGRCLVSLGVKAVDTRDDHRRERFLPTAMARVLPDVDSVKYNSKKIGSRCCSKHAIFFHHLRPKDMYVFEFFLYYMQAYGRQKKDKLINSVKKPSSQMPFLQIVKHTINYSDKYKYIENTNDTCKESNSNTTSRSI